MSTVGRIALFHEEQEEGKINPPAFRGYLETSKGKFKITLWPENNLKVTGGVMYKGVVVENTPNKPENT